MRPDNQTGRRGPLRLLSVAPMLDRTDRHFRYLVRMITRRTLLYTEMVTTGSILHGDRDRLLGYDPAEKPLALQLGGDDPADLARCTEIAATLGYDEVNLNAGCPSDRVQRGSFGACLMASPELVASLVTAMRRSTDLPVTVKHRIGIDDLDSYDDMAHFVETVAGAGCDRFIIHARKAWLTGLSPKENRSVPPLRYDEVYRLKEEHPELTIELNGGIESLEQAETHLQRVDGAMIGRVVYDDPYILATADRDLFGDTDAEPVGRRQVVERMLPYIDQWRERNLFLSHITRHMLMLFAGIPGARAWRRHLSENGVKQGAGREVVEEALEKVKA